MKEIIDSICPYLGEVDDALKDKFATMFENQSRIDPGFMPMVSEMLTDIAKKSRRAGKDDK